MCFTCAFTLTQDQCCVYLRWRDSVWFVVVCNVYGTPICLSGGTRARIPFLSFLPFFFGLGLHLLCFASHPTCKRPQHQKSELGFRRRNNKSGGGSGGGSGGSFFSFPGASASSGSDCKFSKFVHSQEHEPPFSFPFIQALMVSDKRIGRRMSCWWVKGFGPAKRKDPKQSKQAANFKIQKR